jgi:hypothetical protein
MADEFDPANANTRQTRFWVAHSPVNDAYVALFGDKLETASLIPLRHPEIPALGKKRNIATPMEQQYGHERWEQLPKEQTLFSTLEEIDATLEKNGLWRNPETNDIVTIESRPRPKEPGIQTGPEWTDPPGPEASRPLKDITPVSEAPAQLEVGQGPVPQGRGLVPRMYGGKIGPLVTFLRKRNVPVQIIMGIIRGTLTEEQRQGVRDYIARRRLARTYTHTDTTVSPAPPPRRFGIESFKKWLGISEDDLPVSGPRTPDQPGPEGGIASLPVEAMAMVDVPGGGIIDFWHGTPNVWEAEPGFPVGRPDLAFRFTGEGSQVHGEGFYGAEARALGLRYAEELARRFGKLPNLYKGQIPRDIVENKFIDFDLPVSEQSRDVLDAFKKLGYETKTPDKLAGADIFVRMQREMGEEGATQALLKEGIGGMRYLDRHNRGNRNLYKEKSLVKKDGEPLRLNTDWERDGRDVLKYLVDNDMSVADFIGEQREWYGERGFFSRTFGSARSWDKFLDILEGTQVEKSPLTRAMVIWDQPLLDRIGKTIEKEMAAGGFVDKPLYEDARLIG